MTMRSRNLGRLAALGVATLLAAAPTVAQDEATADDRLSLGMVEWSPDGGKLLVSAMITKRDWSDYTPDKWGLYLLELDSGRTAKLTDGALYGAWSPDGGKIAFGQHFEGNWDIVVRRLATGGERRLTSHAAKDSAPAWSPDGSRIAFNSERSGATEIWVIGADGGEPRQITHGEGSASYNPAWSPDGASLVFYLEKGDNRDQIWTTDLAGERAVNLTADDQHSFFPGWTPGGRIVFARGDGSLWLMQADGSQRRRLAGVRGSYARYSIDGKRLAWIDPDDERVYVRTEPHGVPLPVFGREQVTSAEP